MRTILYLFFALFLIESTVAQQQVLLLAEDFETPGNTFLFDSAGINPPSGSNKWIINNEFDGMGIYPNTTSQDSVTSGTINNSPFSTYLHIYDTTAAPGVANANYDPSVSSDQFVYTDIDFCTFGLTDVLFTFFYVCEGSPNAWGEVYYSIDGGSWIQTGDAKYNNQSKWKYEVISDTAFVNVESLRFGFRWVNQSSNDSASISFGVDEAIIVGNYDPFVDGVDIDILDITPDTVCKTEIYNVLFELSERLCPGNYVMELSNSNGNFNSGVLTYGPLSFASTSTLVQGNFVMPSTIPTGSCYRIRINRLSPQPQIIGNQSFCFVVEDCANIIDTQEPLVATDVDTLCAESVIDVPFFSYGTYNSGNVYTAQLSDSNGNFTVVDTIPVPPDTIVTIITSVDTLVFDIGNPPNIDTTILSADTSIIPNIPQLVPRNVYEVIGNNPNADTWDPAITQGMPGNVSGLVPRVPAGCNYYIRVVSTNLPATGSLYGPFCIKQCDITTNLTEDIQLCIMDTVGATDSVEIEIHSWDSIARYLQGNSFQVQLLDMMFFSVVNTGGLGVTFDTTSHVMILTVPGANDLGSVGVAPGAYYMRIVADSSTTPHNLLGTLVRLTIGAPADFPPTIITDKEVYCNTELAVLNVFPFNPDSEYEWLSASFNNGNPFIRDVPLVVDFRGAAPDFYYVFVTEINYNCRGPLSSPVEIPVTTFPNVNIDGPLEVCQGDTVDYDVLFLPETFYNWSVPWGRIVDTSNNEITVVFDSSGAVDIHVFALNNCGSGDNDYQVEVSSAVKVTAASDAEICPGESVLLEAKNVSIDRILSTGFDGLRLGEGNMFNVKALEDVTIKKFDLHFRDADTADVEIYYKIGSYVGSETNSSAWTLIGTANDVVTSSTGQLTPIPINMNVFIPSGGVDAFYVNVTDGPLLRSGIGRHPDSLAVTDGVLEIYEGARLTNAFSSPFSDRTWNGNIHYSSDVGLSYLWSNGDTAVSTRVSPEATSDFSVRVSDTSGCGKTDFVMITVKPEPPANAGPDETICLGADLQLGASGGDIYVWSNDPTISDRNVADPVVAPEDTTTYIVEVTDSLTSCKKRDTVIVFVTREPTDFDTASLCINLTETLLEIELPQFSTVEWSTGETTEQISVSTPGNYVATIETPGSCQKRYEFDVEGRNCVEELVVPEGFTPNGDGLNDYFTVFGEPGLYDSYEIRIFNRWGEMVYQSTNKNELNNLNRGWDGTHRGKLQNAGVFVYYINAVTIVGNEFEQKGNLTLIR